MYETANGGHRHKGVELTASEVLEIKTGGALGVAMMQTPSGRTRENLVEQPVNPFKGIKAQKREQKAVLSTE